MTYVTVAAGSLLLLFFIGEFVGIQRFSIRPRAGTTVWNINVFFSFLWIVAIGLLFFELSGGVLFTVVLALLWFIAQLRAHWIPYLFGAPEEYRHGYENIFKNTITVLPRITRRGIVPSLYHTIILLLLLTTLVTGFRALFQ